MGLANTRQWVKKTDALCEGGNPLKQRKKTRAKGDIGGGRYKTIAEHHERIRDSRDRQSWPAGRGDDKPVARSESVASPVCG